MRPELSKYEENLPREQERPSAQEREAYVLRYAPLIHFIANRMAMRLPPSVSKEELVSAGIVGLLDAIDKFDAALGNQFKTYAEHRIRGAMLDELRKMDWFPRSVRKSMQKVEEAVLALRSRLGREPEDLETAQEMGVGIEEYFRIIHRGAGAGLLNIEELLAEGGGARLNGQGLEGASPLDELKVKEVKQVVAGALRSLSEMEQKVISLYYYDELTLKEIAEVFQLTESRICQIHSKAIMRLRTKLRVFYES
jgi:RNA polymerase sigma factor for flagellar operon FliA